MAKMTLMTNLLRNVARSAAAALIASAAIVSVTGPVTAGAARPSAADDALTASVQAFVGSEPGGASVLVVRDGVAATATVGDATLGGDPITPATRFRVGSISKMFVATMVLQLVDEGLVDLDETLSTYLPDTPIGGDVPVRALLRHRSGLPNYMDDEAYSTDVWTDPTRVFTPTELLGYLDGDPVAAPDTQFLYANTNYVLLGLLVEALDGTDLNTALGTRITTPLALAATRFEIAGEPPIDDLAGAFYEGIYDGDPAAPYDSFASGTWAAGALVANAGDIQAFLDALFGGDLISDDSLAALTDPGEDGYGLGVEVLGLPSGRIFYGHRGEVVGYLSFAGIEPESGDSIVVLTNNPYLQASALSDQITATW
jgi:D-alanyl-D-alanine carboxypeptidase